MQVFGFDTARAFDYENGFYLTSDLRRMGKLLAHYELYKRVVGLPGAIVECGVFKGASLVRFATFRELLESPFSREILGFDAFGAFPREGDAEDQEFIEAFEQEAGTGISTEELQEVLRHKGFGNVTLVPGDINETVPDVAASRPELRIALLHVDVDVYVPTKTILEHLYPRLVPGGLLVLDDYGKVAGETRAVDEYFAARGARLEKLPISHIPAFVVAG
ncbi:MAG: TylF/MycF/NovP-related O-methyltransferase [Myxococcota bacterium]